jgi:2,4-dienoyl-CoA reductase-like NADH-dependent reductase (Old Yellow Enzyme family)
MPKANSPNGFQPLNGTALFSPFRLGLLNLEHRIVQAPLTRMRATKEQDGIFVPEELHVEYYSQRASKGGLQLTEATDIAKYVRRAQLVKANVLTCSRPADTQVCRVYSLNLKSLVGRR